MTLRTRLLVLWTLLAACPAYGQAPYQPLSQQTGPVGAKGRSELAALGMLCSVEVPQRARLLIAPDLRDYAEWQTTQGNLTPAQRSAIAAQRAKEVAQIEQPLRVSVSKAGMWVSTTPLGEIYTLMIAWRNYATNPHRVPDYFRLSGIIFGDIAVNCLRRELYQRGFVAYAPGACSVNSAETRRGVFPIFPHPRALVGLVVGCSYQPDAMRGSPPEMIFIPDRIGDPFRTWPVPPGPSAPPPQNATGPAPGPVPPQPSTPPPSAPPPPKEDPSLADRLLDLLLEKAKERFVDPAIAYNARRQEMGNIPFFFEELRAPTVGWGLGFVERAFAFFRLNLDDFLNKDSFSRQEARQNRLDLAYALGLDMLLTPMELQVEEDRRQHEQIMGVPLPR